MAQACTKVLQLLSVHNPYTYMYMYIICNFYEIQQCHVLFVSQGGNPRMLQYSIKNNVHIAMGSIVLSVFRPLMWH